ncbi:probable E3 ubiquitin-protein ligase RNF217 [Oryza brachyantha]|uniref:probable E3 ubiquitin-protein ligase RNF217 n=1 Tax=Oryza brachyantha TaxID=4533 RepID=UPI001AD9DC12|nr:probable E3 ubiquitin-protein ligase RNF217 [Oryza brachyantha]
MDVDELFLVVTSQGRDGDHAGGVAAMSDKEFAEELQLQEVIVSSAMAANAATAGYSITALPPPLDSADAPAADMETLSSVDLLPAAKCSSSSTSSSAECSCSSSSVPPPPPPPPPSVPATTSFLFCKICLEDVPPSDAHRGSHGCAHAFCAACLAAHIATKLAAASPTSGVNCPEEGCASMLDPELSRHIIPEDTFVRWCDALCWATVLGSSHVYCPFLDCGEVIADERGGGGHVQETECPACRRQFCERCGVAWHGGVSCGEYGELADGDREEGDLAAVEAARASRWRRCPRCRFFVERYDGCVHITCRCEMQFCYGCGREWNSADHSCCHEPAP